MQINYLIKTLLTRAFNIEIIRFTHPEVFWLSVMQKKQSIKYIQCINEHYTPLLHFI